MAYEIPEGFIDLAAARQVVDNVFVNIIGIVVDLQPPTPNRRGEYMLTFKLLDLRLADTAGAREGLTIRYFVRDQDQLPKVRNIGDAVHLRQIKAMTVNGGRLFLSNFGTKTIVVPSASIPTPAFSMGFLDKNRIECLGTPLALATFSLKDQAYIIALRHCAGMVSILAERHARMSVPVPTGPASMTTRRVAQPKHKLVEDPNSDMQPPAKKAKQVGKKFKLVQDLQPGMFADLCGVVVKKFPAQYGCDLYITDYTSNKMMRYYPKPEDETDQERDGDTFGYNRPPKREWRGPWEWTVLKVNLKYPHADFATRRVDEDDVVLLQNVKSNITPVGGWLEVTLWPEMDNPEKLKIMKLPRTSTLAEVEGLMQRKEKYWTARNAQLQRSEAEPAISAKAKKQLQKKAEKRRRKAAKLALEEQEAAELAKKDANPNVRCTHDNVPVTKISDILDLQNSKHINCGPDGREYVLPFINAKYRAKVRVVNFEPKNLEDFAVRPEPEYDAGTSPDSSEWPLHASPSYEWYFSLLLEDASMPKSEAERPRIWVQVHHANAQFLLGRRLEEDPDDLHVNTVLLAALREQLFLLWGNLYEKGDEELSNRPFECIIAEYGVPLEDDNPALEATPEGWKRMYAMQGASII